MKKNSRASTCADARDFCRGEFYFFGSWVLWARYSRMAARSAGGSCSKPVGMSELKFISRFDEGDEDKGTAPDVDYIELHPLGRVENCYRWAGETDVFEALESVQKRYKIDDKRITDQLSAIVKIRSYAPGTTVKVTVTMPNGGGSKTFSVKLGSTTN